MALSWLCCGTVFFPDEVRGRSFVNMGRVLSMCGPLETRKGQSPHGRPEAGPKQTSLGWTKAQEGWKEPRSRGAQALVRTPVQGDSVGAALLCAAQPHLCAGASHVAVLTGGQKTALPETHERHFLGRQEMDETGQD